MDLIPGVWPIPKEMSCREDALPLHEADIVVPAQAREADVAAAHLFADMVADDHSIVLPVMRGGARHGRLPIEFKIAARPGAGRMPRNLPGEEGYLLSITARGAQVIARDARGAQHAAATMIQLVERRERQLVLRGAEIRDWPHKPVRMVHLYLPGADHLSYARRYLRDFLVRYKFNGLFIEVAGGTRLRGRPEIPVAWRRSSDMFYARGEVLADGAITPVGPDQRKQSSWHAEIADGRYLEPDELARLFDWAREYHLDPVPEIQGLTHCYYLTLAHREIAELPEAQFPDAYCPSDPKTYEILFDVMAEYAALTKCRSVHIGHDEWRSGGHCPRCRERDTGELFAEDVLRIVTWLKEHDLKVWMWGDHLLNGHNAEGKDHHHGGVWWNCPQTRKAAGLLKHRAPDVTLLNWGWTHGAAETDQVIADLGFQQIYGNLDLLCGNPDLRAEDSAGQRFYREWPVRSATSGVLGGEISSWCGWDDFELGLFHFPPALYAANLLWSQDLPSPEQAEAAVAHQLPRLRDRMRGSPGRRRLWSVATPTARKHVISVRAACNAPLVREGWDLSGLPPGLHEHDGIPFEILNPEENDGRGAVLVARGEAARPIPVGGTYGSLIFWQVATGRGDPAMIEPCSTTCPREQGELLGWYEIRFADGLTHAAEIRFGENVRAWNEGRGLLYHAHEAGAGGALPDGRPLTVWGLEWTNLRHSIPIESVTLHGARTSPESRPEGKVSDACPILLGITAVERPRLEDC
jgi:hypothetical protein